MNNKISRIVLPGDASQIVAMAMMVYSLPPGQIELDGFAVFTGLGETWRVANAVRAWQASPVARHLLISGWNPAEPSWQQYTLDDLSKPPYNLERTEGVVIQPQGLNTKEQAEWIVDQIVRRQIKSLGIVVSPYHMLRAYLTLLAAMHKRKNALIPIVPIMVKIAPGQLVPDVGVDAWSMVAGETTRIREYANKRDVANYEQLQQYLEWLWREHLGGARPR